jgi:hypothetical protein
MPPPPPKPGCACPHFEWSGQYHPEVHQPLDCPGGDLCFAKIAAMKDGRARHKAMRRLMAMGVCLCTYPFLRDDKTFRPRLGAGARSSANLSMAAMWNWCWRVATACIVAPYEKETFFNISSARSALKSEHVRGKGRLATSSRFIVVIFR